jgi:hypothetical protein
LRGGDRAKKPRGDVSDHQEREGRRRPSGRSWRQDLELGPCEGAGREATGDSHMSGRAMGWLQVPFQRGAKRRGKEQRTAPAQHKMLQTKVPEFIWAPENQN